MVIVFILCSTIAIVLIAYLRCKLSQDYTEAKTMKNPVHRIAVGLIIFFSGGASFMLAKKIDSIPILSVCLVITAAAVVGILLLVRRIQPVIADKLKNSDY